MIRFYIKNKVIIIFVVSFLIVGVSETNNLIFVISSSDSLNLANTSSDRIIEDVDEFLEGTMDNLVIREQDYLSLDKESSLHHQ